MKIVATPETVYTITLDGAPYPFRADEHWRGLTRLTSQYEGMPVEMIAHLEKNVGQAIEQALCGKRAEQTIIVVTASPMLMAALMRAHPATTQTETPE